jgi:23S rRNA pseudouridine1911/1915/1917 synthase
LLPPLFLFMPEHRHFFVPRTQSLQRLDRVISFYYKDLSRTRIQHLMAQGHIKIDGKEAVASRKVKEGNRIDLLIPDAEEALPRAQDIPLDIIYEDEDLLVINKAAGMVTHPAPGSSDQTLVNALLGHCGDSLSGIGGVKRPGIVHRLDKGTSGLLVVAKNDIAHRRLSEQFSSRSLSRTYQALVWGIFTTPCGVITGNIGRSPYHRQKMTVLLKGGKTAVTHYKVLKVFKNIASLVECTLETGRTHQIRVHLTSIGHPIMGDPLYGKVPPKIPLDLKEELKGIISSQRPLLHAWQLAFFHPRTQEKVSFKTPLPLDLMNTMALLDNYLSV